MINRLMAAMLNLFKCREVKSLETPPYSVQIDWYCCPEYEEIIYEEFDSFENAVKRRLTFRRDR